MAATPGFQFQSSYVDTGHGSKEVLGRMEMAWREGSPLWLQYQAEADIDSRMLAGDTEAFYSYGARTFNYWRRNQFTINLLRPKIQMIVGNQIKNRKTSVMIPQEIQFQEPCDELSKSLMWSMQNANAYNQISDAFEKSCGVGMSMIQHWLDYSKDPINGDVRSSVLNYTQIFTDPFMKRMDMSDCRYCWTRKWLSKDRIKILLPGREKDIDTVPVKGNSDGRFMYMPEAINYQQRNLLIYDEFWYQETRKKRMMLDQESGETFEWQGEDDEKDEFMRWSTQNGIRIKEIKTYVPTIRYAVVVQNTPMLDVEAPYGLDRYPFAPFMCFFNPEIPYMPHRIQGLVRNARDMAWAYNRRAKLELDYLEAGINRGYIYDESAVVNPDNLIDNKGNGQNIPMKAGRDINASIRDIPPAQIPPSWFQEKEVISRDISNMMQANEELMGQADDAKAGILEYLRQGANLTMLSPIFNKLDESQKIVSEIHVELMQKNWKPAKFARILGKDPHPLIKNKYFAKFDVQIVDGALTPTQQMLEFKQLFEMIQAGILPNSPEVQQVLIKTAPLQNKTDLLKAMETAAQAQAQAAQAQQQAEMMTAQAQAQLYQSQAKANDAIGNERNSKVEENRAMAIEKIKEAQSKNEQAELDKARAIKELSTIDLKHLQSALQILRLLEGEKEEKARETLNRLEPTQGSTPMA
jgi:hypothetical protein